MSGDARVHFLQSAQHVSNVTIVCEDGQQLSTHTLLLASCSQFLTKVLLEVVTTSCHPLVILLPDFNVRDVKECLEEVVLGGGEKLAELLGINLIFKATTVSTEIKIEAICETIKNNQIAEQLESVIGKVIKSETESESYNNSCCPYCLENFSSNRRMKNHLTLKHEQKFFSKNDKLKSHITKEHDNGRFNCDFCSKTFSDKRRIREHLFHIHKLGKKHICETCGKYFAAPGRLKLHKLRLHGSEEDKIMAKNQHKCSDCGKGFYTSDKLTEHVPIHLEEKVFNCDKCNRKYSTSHNLKIHIKRFHLGLLQLTDEQRERYNARKRNRLADKKERNGGQCRTPEERVVFNEYMRNRARRIRESQKQMCLDAV